MVDAWFRYLINIELDTELPPNYAWVWGGSRPTTLTGENDQMTDNLKWYQITMTMTGLLQAEDDADAQYKASEYFDITDLNTGRIEVKDVTPSYDMEGANL